METTPQTSFGSEYRRLGKKTFVLFVLDHLKTALIALVAAIIFFMVSGQSSLATVVSFTNLQHDALIVAWLAIVVFAIALVVDLMDSWLSYLSYQFALQENALMIKSGIIAKKEIAIPYRQIQNVTIEQNIAHRALGMSRIVILTAGHEDATDAKKNESEGILPALDTHLAEMLQAELLKRTSVERVSEVPPAAA